MSDSNRKRVAVAEETTFGTGPSPLDMFVLGVTGQSLRDQVSYQPSRTIRSDRNVSDVVRVNRSAGGNLPFEITFPVISEGLWYLLRGALCTTETAAVTTASCTTVDATNVLTRASGSFVSDGYVVGDVIKVSGAATAGNNVYARCEIVAALQLTFGSETGFVGNDACTVKRGARMTNGTTEKSFVIEVASADVTKYQLFRGQVVNTLDLSVSDQSILTGSISLEGKTSTRGNSANGNSYTEATSTAVFDSVTPPIIYVGTSAYSTKSFSIGIRNNAAARTQIGSLGPQSVRRGEFAVELSFQSYFANFTEMDAYAGNTATTFWTVLENASGQGLAISIPQIKWTDLSADTQGTNQDDYMTGRAMAYLDPTELITIRVQRFV